MCYYYKELSISWLDIYLLSLNYSLHVFLFLKRYYRHRHNYNPEQANWFKSKSTLLNSKKKNDCHSLKGYILPHFHTRKNQQSVYGILHLVKSTHYGIYCVCIIIIFTKKYFNPFDFFINNILLSFWFWESLNQICLPGNWS